MEVENFSYFESLFFDCIDSESSDFANKLKKGDWLSILNELSSNSKSHEKDLRIGIISLCAFCELNCTGPSKDFIFPSIPFSKPKFSEDVYSAIKQINFLWCALDAFESLPHTHLVYCWWKFRCYFTYQKVLEELNSSLLDILNNLIKKIRDFENDNLDIQLKVLLNLEILQVNLFYGKIQGCEYCLQKIEEYTGLKLELKGALGKRTKFQENAIAQLILKISKGDFKYSPCDKHIDINLPSTVKLDDDVRLDNIQYLNIIDNDNPNLTCLEQLICLNTVQYLQRFHPKDGLEEEELLPYINILINQKKSPWLIRIKALLMKCKLESQSKRTIERAMMQCEEVVNHFNEKNPDIMNRLSYIWASGLILQIQCNAQFADLMLSIGMVKAALEIYLKMKLWEDVIICYTILDLKHKAAKIIQKQLLITPTSKLFCHLADATGNVALYERAWKISKGTCGRVQRQWGNHYFIHKKYDECIKHYQKSCEINSLQEFVWLRLGYAAMTTEKWDLAATAYRRYLYLEPNSFEAWNNLANVYIKQGNKERAYKALNEALKYNYDNWQVWENMLVTSLDTGHFDDVIRGYHRLLDLRGKHLDIEVLNLLVKVSTDNILDCDGNECKRLIPMILKLFGRITSIYSDNSDIWELYAIISPNSILRAQRLLKSFIIIKQISSWTSDPIIRDKIYNLVTDIVSSSLDSVEGITEVNRHEIIELLSSARLTLRSVINVLTKALDFDQKKIDDLNNLLLKLTSLTSSI